MLNPELLANHNTTATVRTVADCLPGVRVIADRPAGGETRFVVGFLPDGRVGTWRVNPLYGDAADARTFARLSDAALDYESRTAPDVGPVAHVYCRATGSDWALTCGEHTWRYGNNTFGAFAAMIARGRLGLSPDHPVEFHLL